MPRSAAKVRLALQQAALDLFGERGFEATTTSDIAARAGVTERTYFRHFPDKREVLFDGEKVLSDALVVSLRPMPRQAPLSMLQEAFFSVVPMLEANRSFAAPRAAVIRSSPALRERSNGKQAHLESELGAELQRSGIDRRQATLAAHIGAAVLIDVTTEWLADDSIPLRDRFDLAFQDLRTLIEGT